MRDIKRLREMPLPEEINQKEFYKVVDYLETIGFFDIPVLSKRVKYELSYALDEFKVGDCSKEDVIKILENTIRKENNEQDS